MLAYLETNIKVLSGQKVGLIGWKYTTKSWMRLGSAILLVIGSKTYLDNHLIVEMSVQSTDWRLKRPWARMLNRRPWWAINTEKVSAWTQEKKKTSRYHASYKLPGSCCRYMPFAWEDPKFPTTVTHHSPRRVGVTKAGDAIGFDDKESTSKGTTRVAQL